jgi:drug/metabolite transporter (DMT)-like permease
VSLRHWSIFVVLCVMWGVPYFFIKLALEDLSPVCIAWLRITLAALVLAPIAWRRGVLQPALRHRGAIVAFAFAELIIPFPLISLAETWISSSLTGLLIASAPLMTAALAPLFGIKEALTVRRTLGLLAGFIGVLTLLGFDDSGGTYQWAGVACVVVATVGYVVGPLAPFWFWGWFAPQPRCCCTSISSVRRARLAHRSSPTYAPRWQHCLAWWCWVSASRAAWSSPSGSSSRARGWLRICHRRRAHPRSVSRALLSSVPAETPRTLYTPWESGGTVLQRVCTAYGTIVLQRVCTAYGTIARLELPCR